MGRLMRGFLITAASAGLMLATQAPFAQAVFDQTPPSLTVNVRPSFVVGDIVEDNQIELFFTRDIAELISWSATDDVGVCSYDLTAVYAGVEPSELLVFSQETQYTWGFGGDYDDDFGGGSEHLDHFTVTARDCTGNATTKAIDNHLFAYQEDGTSPNAPRPVSIAFAGT